MAEKLNPMVREDKMCRSKRRYLSIAEMRERLRERKPDAPLYAYECPYADADGRKHYHLTKHPRPIDAGLDERVNVQLWPS